MFLKHFVDVIHIQDPFYMVTIGVSSSIFSALRYGRFNLNVLSIAIWEFKHQHVQRCDMGFEAPTRLAL